MELTARAMTAGTRSARRPAGSARRVGGSAITEALVSMLVLIPFFIFIPLLGKQGHLQFKANEALRYTIWERTVWPNEDGEGGGAEGLGVAIGKSDHEIRVEARDRVLGHPQVGVRSVDDIIDNNATYNPLLTTMFGDRLLANPPGAGMPIAAETQPGQNLPAAEITAAQDVQQILHLRNGNFVTATVAVHSIPAIQDWGRFRLAGREAGEREGERHGRPDLIRHTQSGGILTDTWLSPNEETFSVRVRGGTVHSGLTLITFEPLMAIGSASMEEASDNPHVDADWAFGEAFLGISPDTTPFTSSLPARYVD